MFGDSIAAGFYDTAGGWVTRLRILTNRQSLQDPAHDCTVYNLSISGDTTEDVRKRFTAETKARLLDEELVILFAIGINDSYLTNGQPKVTEEKFRNNLHDLVAAAQRCASQVVLVGLTPVDEQKSQPVAWNEDVSYDNQRIERYDAILKEVAGASGAQFIDVLAVFRSRQYQELLEDGVHPNTEGHGLLFEIVRDFLKSQNILPL